MTCGNCPNTDGLCYTSLPPQVRCNITGEYHYYGDECNCKDDIAVRRTEAIEKFKELLNRPGALMMAVNYDNDNAPAVAITGEEAAVAYESLLNLPLYGDYEGTTKITVDPKVVAFDQDTDAWKITDSAEYGSTQCLVCGESIGLYKMFDNKPKICSSCRKAVKFIKEKFNKELENYEV